MCRVYGSGFLGGLEFLGCLVVLGFRVFRLALGLRDFGSGL